MSAGIVAYRYHQQQLQVLLVHPGGPFWKNKDAAAWSIPKGEYEAGEDPLTVAVREFYEETGNTIEAYNAIKLQPVKLKSGKLIDAWAVQADFAKSFISSNTFNMEWPPRSGKQQTFDEVDKAEWFTIEEAAVKLNPAQVPLIVELQGLLAG